MDSGTGQKATRINVNEATREQLIELLKQQRAQLRQEQARTKELEQQVRGLHDLIDEKNAEVTALRHQGTMLTEKAANDEDTINALIKQLEEIHSPTTTNGSRRAAGTQMTTESQGAGSGSVGANGAIVTGKVASGASTAVSPTMTAARPPHRLPPAASGAEGNGGPVSGVAASAAAQEAAFQERLAAATETIANKNGEIAKLETQVRELMDVNAFYTAIVAQHDEEEKRRHSLAVKVAAQRTDGDEEDIPTLLQRIAMLESQQEKLQRVVKQSERERGALLSENVHLREDATRLEMEAILSEQWAQRRESIINGDARPVATPSLTTQGYTTASPSQPLNSLTSRSPQTTTPERVPAQVMTSPHVLTRTRGRTGGAPQTSPLASVQDNIGGYPRHRLDIRALPPIHVRNPDPQERELLDRIHLYEDYITRMEGYEADRQSSFDEMERTRAELFASMNDQLEKQRKEIHRLRKATLGTSNSVGSSMAVTVLTDDVPTPQTSPDRDTARRQPGNSVGVQTEAEAEAVSSSRSQEAAVSLPPDASQRRHSAEQSPGKADAMCVERDEAEARLSLYTEAVDELTRNVCCVHSVLQQAYTQDIQVLRAEEASLASQLEHAMHHRDLQDLPSTPIAAATTEAHDDAGPEPVQSGAVGSHDTQQGATPPTEWVSFLSACENTLHREEVELCLGMYGDVLDAYAALLRTCRGGECSEETVDDDDEESALNAQLLAGVHRLATQPIVTTMDAPLSHLPAVEHTEARDQVGTEFATPDVTAPAPAPAPCGLPPPAETLFPTQPTQVPADAREDTPQDHRLDHDEATEQVTVQPGQIQLDTMEEMGFSEEEEAFVRPATVGDDDASSAPDSQRSLRSQPELHNDDIPTNHVATSPTSSDGLAESKTALPSMAEPERVSEPTETDREAELTLEEEEELLRQLAVEAEATDRSARDVEHTPCNRSLEMPVDTAEVTSDVVRPTFRGVTDASENSSLSENEQKGGSTGSNVADEPLLTAHAGNSSSAPCDSSPPVSPTADHLEHSDEGVHFVDHTTVSETAAPDAVAIDFPHPDTEVGRPPGESHHSGEDTETNREVTDPADALAQSSLPEDGGSSLVTGRLHGDGRPSLPPLPENCTSETVTAAIDACHQYALSRHVSQPATPHRGRSTMHSNRTSASFLDHWPRSSSVVEATHAILCSPPQPEPSLEPVHTPLPGASADAATTGPESVWSTTQSVPLDAVALAPHSEPVDSTAVPPFLADSTASTDDDFEPGFDPFA